MIEIIVLLVLGDQITKMARRRQRSPGRYGLLFLGLWIGGELAGAMLGVAVTTEGGKEWKILIIYAMALAGAGAGATTAFLFLRSLPPIEGRLHDPAPSRRIPRSRLQGVIVGGVAGMILGAILTCAWFENAVVAEYMRNGLGLAAIGSLLGLISGVETK